MTFFYNLNDKLNAIREKPETTHKQLNERGEKWIQKAVDPSHKGDLHKALHVPQGATIPKSKINKAAHSKDSHLRHMAQFAKNVAPKQEGVMADEGNAFSGAVVKAKADGIQPGEKIRVGGKEMPLKEKMSPAKAQSFAALAPPKDKITFADKIAGAKKEVDEMLGDVAAEAIKSALSGKQKQLADEENDFTAHKRPQVEKPKVGTITHGHKHDTKHTATGRMVTRRTDAQGNSVGAEDDTATDNAARGRGRPKGADKGPERVTANATKHKGGRKMADEEFDPADRGEYDQEGEMAKDDIKTIVRHAQALEKILGDNDNLPEWVQSKLAKIEGMMSSVDDYMQNQSGETTDESRTETKNEKGEVTSWKETGDWKKSPKRSPESARGKVTHASDKARRETENLSKKKSSGSKPDFIDADKDGDKQEPMKKAVKEKGQSEDKPKKVKEQGGTDTPTASSGFSYGQGIYDSMSRELENMIAESMNVSMNMSTDPNGGPEKSLTVTATDDDALTLGQLLKNAGMGGEHPNVEGGTDVEVHGAEDLANQIRSAVDAHDHGDEPCPDCGQAPCACEEVDEAYNYATQGTDETLNKPDWPTNTETNADALQYAGGLNKPKTDVAGDGQTTVPNTAVHTQDEDALRRLREMAGIKQQQLEPWERTMKEEEVEEGKVVDALKSGAKKVVDKLKGPNDDELLSKLEKETGGKRPEKKDDKKMEESIFSLTNQWKTYKAQ